MSLYKSELISLAGRIETVAARLRTQSEIKKAEDPMGSALMMLTVSCFFAAGRGMRAMVKVLTREGRAYLTPAEAQQFQGLPEVLAEMEADTAEGVMARTVVGKVPAISPAGIMLLNRYVTGMVCILDCGLEMQDRPTVDRAMAIIQEVRVQSRELQEVLGLLEVEMGHTPVVLSFWEGLQQSVGGFELVTAAAYEGLLGAAPKAPPSVRH